MNQLTTTNILSLLDTTKAERQSFVLDLISRIEEGEADPVKVKVQVKKMEDLLKAIGENQRFKDLVMDEATKYGKSFEMYNAKFEIRSAPAKMDYSCCNDAEWSRLTNSIEELKTRLKDREAFLKTIPVIGLETRVDDELVTLYPPVKSPAADIIAVTLK
jgi:transcriptional regulator of nitric oxide reductase